MVSENERLTARNHAAIVLDTSATACSFATMDSAEMWLEATDVVDSEFHGYDALGNRLEITARDEDVFVAPTNDNEYDAAVEELRRVAQHSHEPVTGESLEEMIRSLIPPPRGCLPMAAHAPFPPSKPRRSVRIAVSSAEGCPTGHPSCHCRSAG